MASFTPGNISLISPQVVNVDAGLSSATAISYISQPQINIYSQLCSSILTAYKTKVAGYPIQLKYLSTNTLTSSSSYISFNSTDNFNLGDVSIIIVAADNNGLSGASSIASVKTNGLNKYDYTLIKVETYDPNDAGEGTTVAVFTLGMTSGIDLITTTTPIIINFDINTTAAVVMHYRGIGIHANKIYGAVSSSGNSTYVDMTTNESILAHSVILGAVSTESNIPAYGEDLDSDNGNEWESNTGIADTGSITTSQSLKVFTKNVLSNGFSQLNIDIG